ncbi:MAG: DUF1398 family protein [Chitinophagaceae bacterium]|nr:DUF1398 family protein [Chitinophagaceae bacterium]
MLTKTLQFTAEQIKEKLLQVQTGADFPVLAMNLKKIGVTYYETKMEDCRTAYHGENGYELFTGPNYDPIVVADWVNIEQLKSDISNHQQGKSDYFEISRQSAENGIEKWAVCLITMTCSYIDKRGNKVWVEHIPDVSAQKLLFTLEDIKEAHGKVKSGVDFPAYIREIKQLGVTGYNSYVADGHIDYFGDDNLQVTLPPKYDPLPVADEGDIEAFKSDLQAHQQGKTSFLEFCRDCAKSGIERWSISMNKMTCTYYDKTGNTVLVEIIPG